jgi:hypothetical protein
LTRVAILGCGPAGLIASHAVATEGIDFTIFSEKRKSHMFGAMYLHEPIPGICPGERMEIQVVKLGTREGYARNVYGDAEAPVSWDKFDSGPTYGWSLGATYERLWNLYGHRIDHRLLTRRWIEEIAAEHDMTFSSLPATVLCKKPRHIFKSIPIWVLHGAEVGRRSPVNMMYYNGLPIKDGYDPWYRYSLINGYQSWEYSPYYVPSYIQRGFGEQEKGLRVDKGTKPLSTTCDCLPQIVRIGRFGRWDKHVFTHHTYNQVKDALLQLR